MAVNQSTSAVFWRLLHVVAGLVLSFSFLYSYENYISIRWAYMGFPYREPVLWELIYIGVAVSVVSFCMPRKVDRPYTLFLWFLYAIVFIPTISISFFISPVSHAIIAPLSWLVAVFLGLSLFSGKEMPSPIAPDTRYNWGAPSYMFRNGMLAVWLFMSLVFLYVYRDIISFASADDIYYQRAVWKASGGGAISYMESYFAAVICPALIAIGLYRRMGLYMVAGLLGFILMYTTSAQKSALVVPFVILAVFFSHRFRVATSLNYTAALAAVVVACVLFIGVAGSGNYATDLVLVRTLAAPAQTFGQYHELFSSAGYTWWSNVRGIGLLVPPPDAFAADPNWPSLGYIVGDYLHGGYTTDMNANANLFSGEGVAAAGSFGVIVIGLVLHFWLKAMDFVSRGWNSRFILLIMTPLAFTLTNGHLSTILLSFGGALWMILLLMVKPGASPRRLGLSWLNVWAPSRSQGRG